MLLLFFCFFLMAHKPFSLLKIQFFKIVILHFDYDLINLISIVIFVFTIRLRLKSYGLCVCVCALFPFIF